MRRSVLLVTLLAATALAGCAEDAGPEPAQEDPTTGLDLVATDETGIIRGVVVDAAIVPIPDATITVESTGAQTTSNENGAFGFSDLEPGAYALRVDKVGYFGVNTVATVAAGESEPPIIRVQLEIDASEAAYATAYQWEGYIQCGLSVVAACGVLDDFTDDEFITTHEVDADPTWVQSEMIWDSTQSVSDELWIWHSYSSKSGSFNGSFGWVQGPSPLLMITHADDLNQHGTETEWRDLGTHNDLTPRVFSGSISGTRSPVDDGCYSAPGVVSYCGGVGFTLEQRFSVFSHVFYRYSPPDGWRFSDDPTTPLPPA